MIKGFGNFPTSECLTYLGRHCFIYWAMLYGTSIEVISPASLRGRLADASEEMAEKYRRSIGDSGADAEES